MWRDYDDDYGFGRGYGRGMGRGYGAGFGRGYVNDYDPRYYRPTAEDEIRDLMDYERYLQDELRFVRQRLEELKTENGGE